MIKGALIQSRDLIHKPDVNYRELDALNVSMIKLFDSDPVKFFEQFKLGKKKKEQKGTALIIGDIVDFYLIDCKGDETEFDNRFDEKFALFEGNKGTGQVFTLADTLFDISMEDLDENGAYKTEFHKRFSKAAQKVQEAGFYKKKSEDQMWADFEKNGYDYFNTKVENVGKVVMDVSLLEKGKKVAEILINDEFTADIFKENDDIEYLPKMPIEWVYTTKFGKEIQCKSEIDIMKIDHSRKLIIIKDLKTTYDNELFEINYIKNGYYLQAAFYWLATQYWKRENGFSDYLVSDMEFVVGDTSANNRRPIRYNLSGNDTNKGLSGFSLKGVYHRGIYELIEEIAWAEENNIWNCSKQLYDNKGKLKLNLQYD